MTNLNQIEALLGKAAERGKELSAEERASLREVLDWWRGWKAIGRIGKVLIWAMITMGAVAAAAREVAPWLR
jgi:hypothetical protein